MPKGLGSIVLQADKHMHRTELPACTMSLEGSSIDTVANDVGIACEIVNLSNLD